MCTHISSTAYKRDVGTVIRKAVLLLLSDKASTDGSGIYASKQTMADELCCSRRAVIATINAFIGEGLLIRDGERRCAQGHTVEYRLNLEALEALPLVACHAAKTMAKRVKACTERTSAPSALVNEAHPTSAPDAPHQCTGFTQTILEPSMNQSSQAKACSDKRARRAAFDFPCPAGVDPVDWEGLKANRRAKRAALSEGAHRQIITKLDRWAAAGWPPGPIVAHAVEHGWQTVFETAEMKGFPHANDRNGGHSRHQQQREPCNPLVRAGLAFEAEYLARQENDLR